MYPEFFSGYCYWWNSFDCRLVTVNFGAYHIFRHFRRWTQRRRKNSWSFSRRNTASTQIHQSKRFLHFHFGLFKTHEWPPLPFFFLTNSECCDFLFEIQKGLETLIYFRIYYVNKLVAFCKTCQCFILKFLLLYYTRKKIIKQHLNHIKNCSVVGGPRDWVSWGWGPFDILNASSDQYSA